MSVDINVNTTETNVNINTSTIVETVDITATVQQDTVEIDVYPNVTVVNVTKKDGQDGQDGDNGLSAYEIALENGFVGTEIEWLESLQGQDGQDGTNGVDGTDGQDGQDGKPAYKSYLDTTTDNPPLTEQEWSDSFKFTETDPVFQAWINSNPLNGLITLNDIPDATQIVRGFVNIETQTFKGNKTIVGESPTVGNAFQILNSSSTSLVSVGNNGNVGIGTTTPAHYLDVSKTVNSRTAYGINSTMTASTLQSDVASTGNDETFTNSHYAWSFVASAAHTVGSISVRLKKVGTVTNTTDTIQVKIFSDNAGTPGTLLLTTDSIKMGTLTTSYVEYLFGGEMTLVNGTTYWIAVRKSAAVTGGGSIAIDRNGTALTTCNTATPVSGDWTVNAGQGRYAVYGRSPIGIRGTSTNNIGVYGTSTNNVGVYGTSTNSYGVYGISTNNVGVYGTSTNSYGVYGTSTNYVGVYGTSTNSYGVYGTSTNNVGVYGTSTNSYGVYGTSTNNVGVYGTSTNSYGVYGTSTNNVGVYGTSTNSYGALLTQSGTLTAANQSNAVIVRRNGVTNSTGSLNYSGNVLQITDNPTGTGTVSGALISGSLSVAADGSGTTERIRFDPRVSNGASAVAHMLDTGNALSTAGALLLDVRNNGISKHAVDLNGNIIEKVPTTPASATAAGVQGTICWDANYVYVCVATNTWKRSALGSW
jgi:hypothetical protein